MDDEIPPKAGPEDHMLGDHIQKNGLDFKESPLSQPEVEAEKRRIYKDIYICNIAFFLLFSSFAGLSIIQSSVVGPIGTIGLGTNFGFSIFSCLVLSPLIIRLIGCKYTMVICFLGFLLWMSSNFYPTWGTVLPSAAINGLANGPIWTAQATYFTKQGLRYADISGEGAEGVVAKFFGLFFCFLMFGKYIFRSLNTVTVNN